MTLAAAEPADQPETAAVELRRHHAIESGRPEPAPVWLKAGDIRLWLDRTRSCCVHAPDEAAKAAEWLLDNEYQIRRAVRQVQDDMPPAFWARLPRLAAPEHAGLPRVLMAARGYLDTCHGQPSLGSAVRFVAAYQAGGALTLAELWAFPVMLRLNCLDTIVSALSGLLPDLDAPFSAIPGAAPSIVDAGEMVSRAIVALAAISRISWESFVETTSAVEEILMRAREGHHAAMDFETRDSYRRAVEELAQGSAWSEPDIAAEALRLAEAHTGAARQSHAGWWLVAGGRREIERLIGYRPPLASLPRRIVLAYPGAVYAGFLTLLTALAFVPPLALLGLYGAHPALLTAATVLLLFPATIIGVTLTNWLLSSLVPPRMLPKMDFRRGLPADLRGAVVMPVIFREAAEVAPILSRLERHWITNSDPNLHFAVLSDLGDAPVETQPGDAAIERALIDGIARLNDRNAEHRPFVLLHRKRRWNAAEGVWMGWERKRGKIETFNAFLQRGDPGDFHVRAGDVAGICRSSLIVTLDADTVPAPGSVHRLLGTIAHPLNRPVLNAAGDCIIAGCTFVQPRVEIAPEAGDASLFARLYTGDTAIDIYSRAVSDLYQDLFGEGIFIGKGAYDPASFCRCIEGRFPDNALASHDLIEGVCGGVALASDIVFYEDFPTRYPDYARRLHRWIRGDWQLLPWLFPTVPTRDGRSRNPLSALDRWKIADNLRRSLIPPALVALAVVAWAAMPSWALVWSLLVAAAPGSYLLADLTSGLAGGRRRGVVRDRRRNLQDHAGRWLLAVVFMAEDAVISADAVLRTLWRLSVTRRHLLQWTTAAHVAAEDRGDRSSYWREMAGAPILATGLFAFLAAAAPAALPGALPLLALWAVSPEIARLIARPAARAEEGLRSDDRRFLRHLARRTWAYFEIFAGPADNWLAPDNHQMAPFEETAHRTSPTNVGMQFLSSLTAFDLGFAGGPDIAARSAATLATLGRMPRHRGHLLNWIDTRSLQPLEPRYVSTVDSGNLAVSLVALRQGLLEIADGAVLPPQLWQGLADTLGILEEALGSPLHDGRSRISAVVREAAAARGDPAAWRSALLRMRDTHLPVIAEAIGKAIEATEETEPHEVQFWLERCWHHVHAMIRDLDSLCPWLALLDEAPEGQDDLARRLADLLPPDLAFTELAAAIQDARSLLEAPGLPEDWSTALTEAIEAGAAAREGLRHRLLEGAATASAIAEEMDFSFLFDPETWTFFIGYNLATERIDDHRYDLLASEARLASYFAIAKGDVPVAHWFHLGRPLSRSSGLLTLLSWNGSMFEYLMPALLIRSAPGRLLGQSEVAAVDIQRRYGETLGLPWGVSEAAFAARDAEHRYQYQAFGVAGLGLKHGLAEDYVVTPYASALALPFRPLAAVVNLKRLAGMGMRGRFGLFEALDFSTARGEAGDAATPVKSYMAHHLGMLLAAIGNALRDDILVRRFNRDPRIAAMELLLHERVPWEYTPESLPDARVTPDLDHRERASPLHGWEGSREEEPELHAIGNGRLSAWVTDRAQKTLWWHGAALTGWEPDLRGDGFTGKLFLKDADDGTVWTFDCREHDDAAHVMFHPEKARFHARRHGITATLDLSLAAADDVAISRVALQNESGRARRIEITDVAEIVLAPYAAHERHPAFSKMFVEGGPVESPSGLLFTRRRRRPEDRPPVLLHRLVSDDPAVRITHAETDRMAFLGRQGDPARPAGLDAPGVTLDQGRASATLDPVSALRATLTLAPGEGTEIAFLMLSAGSRENALEMARRYDSHAALMWAEEDAMRTSAVTAHRMGLSQVEMEDAQALAGRVIRPTARDHASEPRDRLPGQPDLWGLGISGDLPIVLLRVRDVEDAPLLPVAVRAHQWWRRNGLKSDLLVLRTSAASYDEPVMTRLRQALRETGFSEGLGGMGGVHLHGIERIAVDQLRAAETLARLVLDGRADRLTGALPPEPQTLAPAPPFSPGGVPAKSEPGPPARPDGLLFDNGLGGFSPEDGAYRIYLDGGRTTPVPWCNVLANDGFGTIVSEAGLGFSWSLNAGEHRLTPWSNDPVQDRPGEALYLRDEETGEIWTTTPLPTGESDPCLVTHGIGRTVWERGSHGLAQEMTVLVAPDAPVKLVRLKLRNLGQRPRRITATYFAQWQLGALASACRGSIVTGYDAEARALTARNGWSSEFADRVAFLTASRPPHSVTSSRRAFLGTGDLAAPEALRRWQLDGETGLSDDACAAYQIHIDLAPGAVEETVFVLGDAGGREEAAALAAQWTVGGKADHAIAGTDALWSRRLGAVEVKTDDPAFDLMVNRWLPYQTWASRVLARAGFHQAGGGIGFRDQLQDMMALLHADPGRVRAHILDCAAHQFEEGDVLHWWHPPGGRGVRTRCSDDMMWLVYATHRYVEATGDTGILDVPVSYLSAPELGDDEEDRYAAFAPGGQTAPLLDHCRRAIERGVTRGAHGLPLIGTGDWNDGMDRVGAHGRGESVWLAWFAALCAEAFAALSDRAPVVPDASVWRDRAAELRRAAETAAWDGAWYVRAFDDEGHPWGSARNSECQIDSISQSWSVLAGSPDSARAASALRTASDRLIDREHRLVRLLTPPFDKTPRDPGYIRGYPPGIRENGGQYTHAATWMGLAFAELGDGDAAYRIFDLINPVSRGTGMEDVLRYRGEPYAVAADVGGAPPFMGRAGWTWYTGAAGWMWRLAVEGILGIRLADGRVRLRPTLPAGWSGFSARLRGDNGEIRIDVRADEGGAGGCLSLAVDGSPETGTIAFPGEGRITRVAGRITERPEVLRQP